MTMGAGAHPRLRTLTVAEARAFYDRFGAKQDLQAFYEDRAVDVMIARADLRHAHAVFELGCGTGRLAARLLRSLLPEDCRYLGVDVSETMVALARERVRPWPARAEVLRTEGAIPAHWGSEAYDRFLSTYVLDLMSDDAIASVLADARRLLRPHGLLCLVSLTRGDGLVTQVVSAVWEAVHRLDPRLVGGCRPIALRAALPADAWQVRHHEVVPAWGLASEVLVASRLAS